MQQAFNLQGQVAPAALPQGLLGFASQWWGRVVLLLIGTAFLTGAFAPVNQFYLAWIGLVPWLIVLDTTRSQRSAFFWSWLGGTFFFIANMWWMYAVTSYGMVALMAILGLYWGYAGIILRGSGLLGRGKIAGSESNTEADLTPASGEPHPLRSTGLFLISSHRRQILIATKWVIANLRRELLIAAVWVAASEWFRGTWPWHGLPWLYLGSTQTPALCLCQIADITGVAGLSFLIAAVNAWIALALINRPKINRLIPSGLILLLTVIGVIIYGEYRLKTEPKLLTSGPKILVVQANYPQDNSGAKGAKVSDIERFHFLTTNDALRDHPGVDLSVWSETMMPPLNQSARDKYPSLAVVHEDIRYLTGITNSALLTGALFEGLSIPGTGITGSPVETARIFTIYQRDASTPSIMTRCIWCRTASSFLSRIRFRGSIKLAVHFGPPHMDEPIRWCRGTSSI